MSVMQLLEEIRALSLDKRKQLMKLMVDTLAEPAETSIKLHSLRELRGLGKEI